MIGRLILRTLGWIGGMAAVLFAGAGTWDWPAAWWFVIVMTALSLGGGLWLIRTDPGLFEERMRPLIQDGQPPADRLFMVLICGLMLLWLLIAALDRRFLWSAMPQTVRIAGVVLTLAGFALSFWVLRENSFAAPVIKMQAERGHRVIDSGPYAVVRHPMYSGAMLFFLGLSLWLGSWWSAAVSLAIIILFGWRATVEEHALRGGLPGYADYTTRVRHRLLPGLW